MHRFTVMLKSKGAMTFLYKRKRCIILQKTLKKQTAGPDTKPMLFSSKTLRALIIPLIIEQMLSMMVGLADTVMITYAGEAAISGVSLVDMINGVFIYVYSALATGGAVVVSQYVGSGDTETGSQSASQLVTSTTIISLLFMAVGLLAPRAILGTLFGRIEADVMSASITYFTISAISYPFIALYSSCAALFRAMGNSRVTMIVSIIMNVINVIGNAIAIFALGWGVAGVAIASLIGRVVAAVIMFILVLNKKRQIYVTIKEMLHFRWDLIKKILYIAVPSGIENGLFQVSKVALTSIIALFGTAQIAANGVANSIDYVGAIIVGAIGLATVTVVGQCVGANDYEQARYYVKKLQKMAFISSLILNAAIIAAMPLILKVFSLSEEASRLTFILVVLHNVFVIVIQPFSGLLGSAIRAAGDVKFAMVVSIISTVVVRVAFSFILGVWMNMGVIGIWISMGIDWAVRAVLLNWRYRSGKWTQFRVI